MPLPKKPWWDPSRQRASNTKKHETRVAEDFGGRPLPCSGGLIQSNTARAVCSATGAAAPTLDGDVESATYYIEHKRTEGLRITLNRKVLRKIQAGAHRVRKTPLIVVTMIREDGGLEDWVVLPREDFKRLTRASDE